MVEDAAESAPLIDGLPSQPEPVACEAIFAYRLAPGFIGMSLHSGGRASEVAMPDDRALALIAHLAGALRLPP